MSFPELDWQHIGFFKLSRICRRHKRSDKLIETQDRQKLDIR